MPKLTLMERSLDLKELVTNGSSMKFEARLGGRPFYTLMDLKLPKTDKKTRNTVSFRNFQPSDKKIDKLILKDFTIYRS